MSEKAVRGIRGAITLDSGSEEEVLQATGRLLREICARNSIEPEQIASIIFAVTPDIDSAYPARAARDIGWTHVPLLCCSDMKVQGALPRVIRVLVHVNTSMSQAEIAHVYLGSAAALRPDLA